MLSYFSDTNRAACVLYTGNDTPLFGSIHGDCACWGFPVYALESDLNLDKNDGVPLSGRKVESQPFSFAALRARACFHVLEDKQVAPAFRAVILLRITKVIRFLRAYQVQIALCSEDGISADLSVLTAIRWLRVPLIDVPFGNGTGYEIEFDLAKKQERGELLVPTGRQAKLLRMIAPHWVKAGRFEGAVFYRPEVIFAMLSLDAPIQNPWIVHGGMSDVLCAENEIGLIQYREEKIPEQKLRLTGSPYCDTLVNAANSDPAASVALRRPQRITPGLTRILVSWPPSYHETYPGRNEFDDYTSMTLNILLAIQALPGVEVTISLHPACPAELASTISAQGLAVTEEYLISLFGLHDIFVTYFSSTIRWALAAGKPVVNYDAYGLELSIYGEEPGFVNTASKTELLNALTALVTSEETFSRTSAEQIAVADRWGVLDGRCCERIMSEMEALVPAIALGDRSSLQV